MKNTLIAFALLICGSGMTVPGAAASDRQNDIDVLAEKKVNIWPRLYTGMATQHARQRTAILVITTTGRRTLSSSRTVSGSRCFLTSLE